MKYIPASICKDAVFLSHKVRLSTEKPVNEKQLAWERYELYRDTAGLVISPLLHCVVPCLATGIPVIFAKDTLSYRFGFCDKLVKIYDKDEYKNIDWNPNSVYFEELKELVYKVASNRLKNVPCENEILKLHNFYMDFERKDYPFDYWPEIQQYLSNHWTDHSYPYEYSIWGLCELSVETVQYIKREYPNAILKHVYDMYRIKTFEGIKTEHPGNIINDDVTILVTAQNARDDAKMLFGKIGKDRSKFCC